MLNLKSLKNRSKPFLDLSILSKCHQNQFLQHLHTRKLCSLFQKCVMQCDLLFG